MSYPDNKTFEEIFNLKIKHIESSLTDLRSQFNEMDNKLDTFLTIQKEIVKLEESQRNIQKELSEHKNEKEKTNDRVQRLETSIVNSMNKMENIITANNAAFNIQQEKREKTLMDMMKKTEVRVDDATSWIDRTKGSIHAIMVIGTMLNVAVFSGLGWLWTSFVSLQERTIKMESDVTITREYHNNKTHQPQLPPIK